MAAIYWYPAFVMPQASGGFYKEQFWDKETVTIVVYVVGATAISFGMTKAEYITTAGSFIKVKVKHVTDEDEILIQMQLFMLYINLEISQRLPNRFSESSVK